MRTINQVFLVGHLGQDPTRHTAASGKEVVRFSIATNRYVRQGDGWVTVANWHNVVAFDRLAEKAGRFLGRGAAVAVQGELRQERWQDRDGNNRVSTKVVAHEVSFLTSGGPSLASVVKTDARDAGPQAPEESGPEASALPF